MRRKTIYIILAVIAAVAAVWAWSVNHQGPVQPVPDNTTSAINSSLNNISVGSPNFNAIDKDINSL